MIRKGGIIEWTYGSGGLVGKIEETRGEREGGRICLKGAIQVRKRVGSNWSSKYGLKMRMTSSQ